MKLKSAAVKLAHLFLTAFAAALLGAVAASVAMVFSGSGASADIFRWNLIPMMTIAAGSAAAAASSVVFVSVGAARHAWRPLWRRFIFANYFFCGILFSGQGIADRLLFALFDRYAYSMPFAVPLLLYFGCPMITGVVCSRFLPQPERPQEIML